MSAKFLDGIKAKDIDGKEVDLGSSYGSAKKVLIVNLASKCGLTDSNYKEIAELTKKYTAPDLVVLGFPCNQFGAQEPGTEAEIKNFVETKYNAKFPLFSKINVNGNDTHPLYKKLKDATSCGDIQWNFAKFLITDGDKVEAFGPRVEPKSIIS
ncbi:hypothetical protein GUITHDRAFT_76021 [Guillardia theta CCMP2712]|uniref:Glutathione peroxidase n=1 Tax=Guillardia theta (strain CCMP2712) TaxID=905079 RepID=L1IUP8_GUITC|nr:hypothetical protein GUITHDRAFT_76021 [Guillardia theta CCMP2712]EKX39958.1 hypothetical protein GUITHDRAFT_76021 [Guillardia theta CCMP2712]|eukprot:XP_005826938.1 hypothetical protein GUITHDRAFT_76021 [Guillardia theta CCMP2712]